MTDNSDCNCEQALRLQKQNDELRNDRAKDIARQMRGIYERCAHWKNSTDGSYGLALHNAGLSALEEALAEIGYEYKDGRVVEL